MDGLVDRLPQDSNLGPLTRIEPEARALAILPRGCRPLFGNKYACANAAEQSMTIVFVYMLCETKSQIVLVISNVKRTENNIYVCQFTRMGVSVNMLLSTD